MFIEFGLTVLGISFLIGFGGTVLWKKDSLQWRTFLFFYTFLPAVICIVVFFVLRNTWSLGDFSFTKFSFWYAALGLLIPLVFQTINLLVQLQRSSYAFKADTDLKKVIPIVLVNVVLLIIFVSGEEIGWRGFIQSQAIERYGSITGVLLLGLVWGFWHAPVALRGHNLSACFWAEAFLLYPYMCICYSFPMAFLTIQSGSIWPALIFHATNNALGSISIQFVDKKKPQLEILLLMITGTVVLLPFAYFLV
ncbi:MAG TPA: type II CAAX endopeptidase family protein [Anaerolineales bacterium]|nr:type II CAAX endopeptidase family protein [Anaerolineales bacterium]